MKLLNRKQRRQKDTELMLIQQARLTANDTVNKYSLAVILCLRDELGFGKKRAQRFMKRLEGEFDDLNAGRISFDDMKEVIKDELDITITEGTNGR